LNKHLIRRLLLLGALLGMQACGGGSGNGPTGPGGRPPPPPPPPAPPPGQPTVLTTAGMATNGAGYRLRILNLAGHGLEWDAGRGLVFASLTNASVVRPGEIVALDPVQARIVHAVRPDVAATRLRLSGGGGYLYASHPGNGTIVRYLPGTLDPDNTIRLGFTIQPGGSPLYANDLAPHPREPRTLAIALADPEIHPKMRGPVVYDDDVPRPLTGQTHSTWGVAWNADGSRLYGFTEEQSPSSVIRFSVDQDGLTAETGWTRGLQNSASALNLVGEYLHSNVGEVLREHDMHRAGEYTTPWSCLFALPEEGATMMFALCGADDDDEVETALVVHAFNAETFQRIGKATIRGLNRFTSGFLLGFTRWGESGLAFVTPGNQLVLIDGQFVTSMTQETRPAPVVETRAVNAQSSSGKAFTYREVALDANDMVYDRSRGRIYLSSPGRAEYAPQAILSLDPVTGLFDGPRPVGSEPNTLILAGEGEYLYVGTDGSSSVARVRLDTWQRDATLELGRESSGRAHLARQIFPAPGAPRTVVVARTTAGGLQGITTPGNGFVVFDDALQRPRSGGDTMFENGPRTTVVQWGSDANTIYGGNTETSNNFYSRYLVDEDGPLFQFMYGAIAAHNFVYRNGRFHESHGRVLDADSGVTLLEAPRSYTSFYGGFYIEESLNRAYFVEQIRGSTRQSYRVHIHQLDTMTLLDSIRMDAAPRGDNGQSPVRLIRWGEDGVAVLVGHFRAGNSHLLLAHGPAVLANN
jgi:hypothetical protein